jgi:undecaprenyl-diphosphatase
MPVSTVADIGWWQALVLALVQGITEFLPISSSAHLILLSWLTGWPDQGVVVDIAAHFGTLLAVIWYFRQDLKAMFRPARRSLLLALILASLPLAVAGLLFHDVIETRLRSAWVIAFSSIAFGLLLWLAEWLHQPSERQVRPVHLLKMGLWQVLALIPGTSRSGITLTGGLFMGLSKKAAARASFLLAIPALLMVTAYGGMKIMRQPTDYALPILAMVMSISFAVALLTITWFMRFLEKTPLSVFAIYRILLGVLLIVLLLQQGLSP